jgi:soluble lytic murein transglycosylase-like protein
LSEQERHARRLRRRRQQRRRRLTLGGLALTVVGLLASGLVTTRHGDAAPPKGTRAAVASAPSPCPVPHRFRAAFARASARAGLEPALLVAVARAESRFDPHAVSSQGARGLLQLMPETARELRVDAGSTGQNLAGGARYLRRLLDRFASLRLALAAYNAGPTSVDAYGGVPPFGETEHYIREVTRTRHELSGCRFL